MRKFFLLALAVSIFNLRTYSQQPKKDSVMVVISLDTTTYKQLLYSIDNNVDSKRITQSLLATISSNAQQQQKKDSIIIIISLDTTTYKQLLYTIDTNIDSKKVTTAILEVIQRNAQLLFDKPKQTPAVKGKN